MVAIIIVAMLLALIAFGSYVVSRFSLFLKRERNFYDIFALVYFFGELESIEKWEEFLENTETITVTRRLALHEEIQKNDVISTGVKSDKVCCYEFDYGYQTISIYLTIPKVHHKKAKKIFRDSFSCEIEPRKVKMFFYGSFDQKIFIVSHETALQTLFLQLESEERFFNETYKSYADWSNEIKETQRWVEHQKESIRKQY